MLTTIDNPFNPFTNFDEWLAFDEGKGYYTNEYLARITKGGYELSEADDDLAQELAIDEILRINVLGIYRRVRRTDTQLGDSDVKQKRIVLKDKKDK